jgi:hypothetical protein
MRFVPGAATYKGDVSQSILEEKRIMGPTTYDTFLVAAETNYDPETDTTRVRFRNATTEDYS